jgi:hypothetical protein
MTPFLMHSDQFLRRGFGRQIVQHHLDRLATFSFSSM